MKQDGDRTPLIKADYLNNELVTDTEISETEQQILSYFTTNSREKRQVMVVKDHQHRPIRLVPELCDLVIMVGPNKVPVYGIKALVISRSRVFYKLLLNEQRQEKRRNKSDSKTRVIVPDYQPGVIRKLMEYLHCGRIDITARHIVGLYCASVEFQLPVLRKICMGFLKNLKPRQKCRVKDWLYYYGGKPAVKSILQIIGCTSVGSGEIGR